MLNVKQRTVDYIEIEDNYVFEVHLVTIDKEEVYEVWLYNTEYNTKGHSFSILKTSVESMAKLYKHIEEHKDEYILEYKENFMEE